ncbi:protein-export chaperone SecB [Eikenella sp. S3360]|uniref:Protein-export protein SecB n=1 Tax=Eikenella glucosivorans TaxID=2766967 RepID=A0ABS0ND98_9NEIS|nr:protein-export chaperone SecB [Eikenella glucosivorans]MBH5330285.1 protein-export chaperone SecB [Eikenella glucosivorans]
MSEQQQQPVFSVEKLYVNDLSLEVPHAPEIFLNQETPEVEMQVHTDNKKLEDDFYNVTVTVTVTAKLADGKVLFLNEVAQSGIFRLANIPEQDVKVLLGIACPNILYPYAREAVSSTITRAGFPPVVLAPINFEAMYEQQQAAANAPAAGNA